MSSDDRQTSAPPDVTVEVAATNLLDVVPTSPPMLAQPETLVDGLRLLQQRIPDFTHLSWQEKRSHARAATLDPEFIEHGLQAAAVWRETKMFLQRSGEELREDQEEIRRWDQVIVELRAITNGIEAANLKRKHRLGSAILQLYSIVGINLRSGRPEHLYMHPYYENMKRAYMRRQQFRRRKRKEEEAEG